MAGVHGTTAITAITAQNTVAVTGVEAVSPAMIVAQVRAVVEDIGVDAVKIGMLGSATTAEAVGEALDLLPDGTPVVVDPVMVAESGARLLDADAQAALVERVIARATVVTPNLPEARVLAGDGELDVEGLARAVHALGARAVVVTGGHRDEAVDVLFDGERIVEIAGERYADGAAHGSGCTHSSTLAARLALGDDLESAVREAKRVASEAVRDGLGGIGRGGGPGGGARPGAEGGGRGRSTCSDSGRRSAERPLAFDIIGGDDEVPAHEAGPRRGPHRGGQRRRGRGGGAPRRGVPPPARPGPLGRGAEPHAGRAPASADGQGVRRDPPRRRPRHLLPSRGRRCLRTAGRG